MMEKQESPFFVGVRNPLELRRTLLETSRDIIDHLKKYEELTTVREEKKAHTNKLRRSVREISKLISRLKTLLPSANLRVQVPKEEPAEKREEKAPKKSQAVAIPKEMNEIDKLEAELNAIEEKLKELA